MKSNEETILEQKLENDIAAAKGYFGETYYKEEEVIIEDPTYIEAEYKKECTKEYYKKEFKRDLKLVRKHYSTKTKEELMDIMVRMIHKIEDEGSNWNF